MLSIQIGENESAKYWLSVLNELKNRGVQDILILCADGLTGIREAITTAYPQTEYQRCLVHQVRNTLKYVADKDRKAFANDLKTIYNAASETVGRDALDTVTAAWNEKYPCAMKRWYDNWDAICPIFKFSAEVRTVIYTTNAIESLNSTYRRLNSQRSVFPSDTALLKALYAAFVVVYACEGHSTDGILLKAATFACVLLISCINMRVQKYKRIRAEAKANGTWNEETRQEAKKLFIIN